MRGWFDARARVIADDPVLARYGAMLGLLQAVTAIAWLDLKHVARLLTGDDVVCWPFFPACDVVRAHLSPSLVRQLVAVYAGLGVAAAVAFLMRRAAGLGTLLASASVGAFVHALDYRMRLNQTYMLAWVVLVFALARDTRKALTALLVAFYVASGVLKLGPEWLSGRALYARPWLVPDALVPAACAYVVLLEVVLVWGLLSRRRVVRALTLAQLALFHLVSFPVVGWYYPVLMAGLLSLFVLGDGAPVTFAILLEGLGPRASALRVVGVFGALQLVPACFRGDAALTGEGRLVALHMFDAKVSCEGGAVVRAGARAPVTIPLVAEGSDTRSKCDPIILLAHARLVCREPWARAPDTRVSVEVDAKRATDPAMRPLVRIPDVCAHAPDYALLRENAWIVAR